MSSLQKLRNEAIPILPKQLQNLTNLNLEKGEILPLKENVKHAFSHLSEPVLIHFRNGGSKQKQKLKVGILLSGGPAAGGHNVIAGVFDALKQYDAGNELIGFLGGPSGLIKNKFIHLNQENIVPYRNQGGFDLLGTGRTKIETPEQFEQSLQTVTFHQLDGLIIVGGDDSNTNAALLAEFFALKNSKTAVIGVPKTIDGDLKNNFIEASFGFDTASKVYSELIGNIGKDALSQKKYYFFIKVMGRTASHLILECALQTQPNLTLISEEIQKEKKSLKQVIQDITQLIFERSKQGKDYGVILIPEGLVEFVTDLEADLPKEIQKQMSLERDPHGNLQVSKIETERLIIKMVEKALKDNPNYKGKFSAQPLFFGYEGRCSLPSHFDSNYCFALGQTAVLLVKQHLSGYMAVIKNLQKNPNDWECMGVPLVSMIEIKNKPLIQKSLVNLEGIPFQEFAKHRNNWRLQDHYLAPGPIQFFGPSSVIDSVTKTLQLENSPQLN